MDCTIDLAVPPRLSKRANQRAFGTIDPAIARTS
jgi:hypothetical protein